jgi:nitroreductase
MVLQAMQALRSVRQFKAEPLPDDVLRQILNAGRRAQSSKNSQPWQFVVIRERDTLKALSECGQFAGHLAGAAVGVALVSEVRNDFDLGQAAANMQLAAWELGVGSCIAAMWEPERAKEILGIPQDYRFTMALSFGYPADDWQPARMGGRRTLDELIHSERWGQRGSESS